MKNIKFFLFLNLLLLININLFSATNPKVIIYSTNPQYPPYDWSTNKNTFEGASIDLLKMLIPSEYELVPEVYPWVRAQKLAEQGEIDLLLSLRITPERQEYLDFTTYRAFPNPIVLFVKKGNPIYFDKWDDLKDYVGGVSLGDTFGGGFDEYWKKELKIEKASDMQENFKKLLNGRIDYFVTGYYMGMAYIKANDLEEEIFSLDKNISNMDIYFGFSKKSNKKFLLAEISKKLEELDKKGVPDKLLKQNSEKFIKNPQIYEP